MKAIVTVMLKEGVLDPQGKAIGHALHTLGFPQVGEVRAGKSSSWTWPRPTRPRPSALPRKWRKNSSPIP